MATEKFYQDAKFLTLKREWDQKLSESGFEDIENEYGELEPDRGAVAVRRNPARADALAAYFTEAEAMLATHVFDSPEDRAIWTHHARGSTEHEVARLVGVTRQTVNRRLTKYRKRFGLTRPR